MYLYNSPCRTDFHTCIALSSPWKIIFNIKLLTHFWKRKSFLSPLSKYQVVVLSICYFILCRSYPSLKIIRYAFSIFFDCHQILKKIAKPTTFSVCRLLDYHKQNDSELLHLYLHFMSSVLLAIKIICMDKYTK